MLQECLFIKGEAFMGSNKGVHAECTHIALYFAFTYRLVRTAKQKPCRQLSVQSKGEHTVVDGWYLPQFKARIPL